MPRMGIMHVILIGIQRPSLPQERERLARPMKLKSRPRWWRRGRLDYVLHG